jgi:hypothetical protein
MRDDLHCPANRYPQRTSLMASGHPSIQISPESELSHVLRQAVAVQRTVLVDAGDTQYELDVHPTRETTKAPDREQVARTIAGIRRVTGGWKQLVDTEQLTAELYERRRMTRGLPLDG